MVTTFRRAGPIGEGPGLIVTTKGIKMYKTVVVPLDGSQLAEQAIPYARSIAEAYKANVILLRMVEPMHAQLAVPEPGLFSDKLAERFHGVAESYLKANALRLASKGLIVSTQVRRGSPADEIIRVAGNDPSAVVVMTTRGKSAIATWLLGSVTTKVLHRGSCDVIVVPIEKTPSLDKKIATVIVPLDGSRNAEQALPHAISLAKIIKARITITQVVPAASIYEGLPEVSKKNVLDLLEDSKKRSEGYLVKVASRLAKLGIMSVSIKVLMGYPARSIAELAGKTSAGFIVMTAHGKAEKGTWVLGSVTDQVVRQSIRPVLVVKPQVIKRTNRK